MAATANVGVRIGLAGYLRALLARLLPRTHAEAKHEFQGLLRESASLFVSHPVPLLTTGLIGFGGAALIGNLLYTILILDVYSRLGNFFSASLYIVYVQMLVQALLGFLLMSFSRGAITWMALHSHLTKANDDATAITLKNAARAVLRNWRPLLLSAWVYGILMSLAVAGITYALREVRLDLSNYRWVRGEANAIASAMMVRGINIGVPDPGSPFTEMYSFTRFTLSRSTPNIYYGTLTVQQMVEKVRLPLVLVLFASSVLVLIFDTLLCFRHAEIMRQKNAGMLAWLGQCVRLAHAHFWRVASARLGLRLMTFLITLFCLTLPLTVQQGLLIPLIASHMQNYLPYALNNALINSVLAMANAVFVTFALVFDVRLNQRLAQPSTNQDVGTPLHCAPV